MMLPRGGDTVPAGRPPAPLVTLVRDLLADVAASDAEFARNYRAGVHTYPIPFFGDLPRAEVITVGRNPSAREFEARGWPATLSAEALATRLLAYFDDPVDWFAPWERALTALGASYGRNAAHLDVTPRATASGGKGFDVALFERMAARDLPWMVRLIGAAPRACLVLVAGALTGARYLTEFLRAHLPASGARLEGEFARPRGQRGWTREYALVLGARRLPVYFCSSSPSDRFGSRFLVAERVARDAPALRRYLA